ncbi:KH domain-containing protein [Oceanivirga miroungae]|uniref:Uncharacterized protein n=1 Tax=Oceanivirga miroungae TaxID=1130046 RepID=A0A6I8MDZ9_9FUSO|nr:KH domain-containing protein [Oceanivirga miroungae]VWL85321.1 hypothetical protein OMES3154_00605 [Oceanivirga miroungae]
MVDYEKIVKFFLQEYILDENYEVKINKNKENITITVVLDKKDMGKLIGKNGNIITSLRNLINSISNKDKKNVKILVKNN